MLRGKAFVRVDIAGWHAVNNKAGSGSFTRISAVGSLGSETGGHLCGFWF